MLTYPDIDPIAFTLGPLAVRWYGLMYLFGFLLIFYYLNQRKNEVTPPWSRDLIGDVIFYSAMGTILGGTIGYWLFYASERILQDPLILIKFWQPGRAFHGGLIGVIVAIFIFCRVHQRRFLDVMDFIAPAVPIGLGLGRLGNFLNAELWGRVTEMPWGMVFKYAGDLPRHPSQLYEFFLEGIVLFLILHFYARTKPPMGSVAGLFAIGYGAFRILVEFFREPDPAQGFLWTWITKGQLLSIPMILIGVGLMIWAYRHKENRNPKCNNILI